MQTFSTTERTALNALTDTLTARVGVKGKTFLVLDSAEHGRHAWPISEDPKGRDAATLLALAWQAGGVMLGKWTWAEQYVPTFAHDCDACTFLGSVETDRGAADVWHCPREADTIIVRHGSDGPDYRTVPFANALTGSRPWERDAAEMVADHRGIDLPAAFFLYDPRSDGWAYCS